jgi:23S rRNA (cytosine1962-C5)-methyltransferase
VEEKWEMRYDLTPHPPLLKGEGGLKFWVMTTPGRHLGVFPEVAAHWDWFSSLIAQSNREINVLNLFGYTGLASLAAAAAGARVTHIDASKKSVSWARDNQALSNLTDKPHPLDRGRRLEVCPARSAARRPNMMESFSIPQSSGADRRAKSGRSINPCRVCLRPCRECLSENPLFVVTTIYAVRASAIHVAQAMDDMMSGFGGKIEMGELVTREQSAGRLLSQAVYARWEGKSKS